MPLTDYPITLQNKSARFYQLQPVTTKQKTYAHFYGGNGFTVGAYEPLLLSLSTNFHLSSLAMRGYWYEKPEVKHQEKVLEREQDADLLIEFLQKTQDSRQGNPVIGIGHSQGATATAIAAAKRPDLFSELYFIEPVTFTRKQKRLYDLMPNWIKMHYEPFKSTLQKQNNWATIDDYYQYLRNHKAYKRVSNQNLKIYAQNSLVKNEKDGFELLFASEQEIANYLGKAPFIDDALKALNKTNLPYHIIKGKPTMFISEQVRKEWRLFVPEERIVRLPDYGHLLPIEAPELVANTIIELSASTNNSIT